MTLVLKSNVNAVKGIPPSSGYKGPSDYVTFADFSKGAYIKDGVAVALSNILTSPSQRSNAVVSDKYHNVGISPAGVPRIGYIPAYGIYGVQSETSNKGCSVGPDFFFQGDSLDTPYAVYSNKGSLSFDKTKVNFLGGTGNITDPYIFKRKSDSPSSIRFTTSRPDTRVYSIICVGNRVPLSIAKDRDVLSDSDLVLNVNGIDRSNFTMVFRTVSPRLGAVLGNPLGYIPVVKFYGDNNSSFSFIKVRGISLNVRAVSNGATTAEIREAAPVNFDIDTYAISCSNGIISCYMNGAKIDMKNNLTNLPGFLLNEVRILSADNQWSVPKYCDHLVNAIVYNRTLSSKELSECVFV